MAEPKLKDVLDAISQMQGTISEMQKGQVRIVSELADLRRASVRSEREGQRLAASLDDFRAATKLALEDLSADVATHRSETKKGFADLDEETGGARVKTFVSDTFGERPAVARG